ncbi:hypothetical protein FHG87_007267 [Trinorchestia longiramus]|nr:hypothetical protein FHG87_007267 [Trinorchestia longiramus]
MSAAGGPLFASCNKAVIKSESASLSQRKPNNKRRAIPGTSIEKSSWSLGTLMDSKYYFLPTHPKACDDYSLLLGRLVVQYSANRPKSSKYVKSDVLQRVLHHVEEQRDQPRDESRRCIPKLRSRSCKPKTMHKISNVSLVIISLALVLVSPSFSVASPQVRFPPDVFPNTRFLDPSPRFIPDSDHHGQLFQPLFVGSKKPHDTFIVEPYTSEETSLSPYAPISSSSHHDQRRKPSQSVNQFHYDDITRKPLWNSSRPNRDSSKVTWPSGPSSSGQKIHFPSEPDRPYRYSRERLPAELAALDDFELDAFFDAIHRNSSRYARRPTDNFAEAIPQTCWYKSTKYNCGLSVSCVFQGARPLDLCNGGMIWSCCVPRDRVDAVDSNAGIIEDVSKCTQKKCDISFRQYILWWC